MQPPLDRFRAPTAADALATCVCCGDTFHYERLNELNECPACAEAFEDDEKESPMNEPSSNQNDAAAEILASSAVSLCERYKRERDEAIALIAAKNEALHIAYDQRNQYAKWYEEADAARKENLKTIAQLQNTKWLIWSNEHNGWWKPNSIGYCRNKKDAGRFDYKEACKIVENANFHLESEPHEAMVLDVQPCE